MYKYLQSLLINTVLHSVFRFPISRHFSMIWFWGADCLAMFSPTRLTWAQTSVAKPIELWLTLVREAAKRDQTSRTWRCRHLLPQVMHKWPMLHQKVSKSCGTTSLIFVVPPCFLAFYHAVDCWSSRILMFSLFFHVFSLLLSRMMCSPSCRSFKFAPTCRPFSPVFSLVPCLPVGSCHYLPKKGRFLYPTGFWFPLLAVCNDAVPNACPSVSVCIFDFGFAFQLAPRMRASDLIGYMLPGKETPDFISFAVRFLFSLNSGV